MIGMLHEGLASDDLRVSNPHYSLTVAARHCSAGLRPRFNRRRFPIGLVAPFVGLISVWRGGMLFGNVKKEPRGFLCREEN